MSISEILFSELLSNPKTATNGIMFWEGSSAQQHYHDFFEISVVFGGAVDAVFNGERRKLEPNTVVLIRPYDIHYKQISEGILCNLAMTSDSVNSLLEYYRLSIKRLLQLPNVPIIQLSEHVCMQVKDHRDKIAGKFLNEDHANTIDAKVLFSMLLANFYQYAYYIENMPDWLHCLITEMDKPENYCEGLPAIKRISCKTQEHLCRTFQKYLDTSPSQYINSIRLSHSAEMLAKTTKDVMTILFEVGFSSPSYFYKRFSDKYGVSPNTYRRLNRKPMEKII